jgi:hypothetical protein
MLKFECSFILAALVVAFACPNIASDFFAAVERHFRRLARHRGWAVLVVGLAALGLRAALLPLFPIPKPVVHDEFGYLLAADTYAHGRLTNPPHPMWEHFETFSVIQRPTYQCFAQPAQGMILAAGRVIAGHPFWGTWLAVGVMCAAICWMLQGWLPAGWAMLGGVLAILCYGATSYWANSYWGGLTGAIGGALALGALPRIQRSPQVRYALIMGAGLAILANSRPYEGFAFSLPIVGSLLLWALGSHRPSWRVVGPRIVLPLMLLGAFTASAMAYYNWRVTGNPLRLAYQVDLETNVVVPYMIWQKLRPEPVYHHEVIRKMFALQTLPAYYLARSPAGLLLKAARLWRFFLGPALTLPFLMLTLTLPIGFSWRHISRRTRFLLVAGAVFLLALALETFCEPHYASPATGLILALVLLAMRRLQLWRIGRKRVGLFLVRAVPVICVLTFVLRLAAQPLHITLPISYVAAWDQRARGSFGRDEVLAALERLPGCQLVIVRYTPNHDHFNEWVYNEADIDAAKVVWARDMGAAQNEELINYFKGRQVHLLEADAEPPRLSDYASDKPDRSLPPARGESLAKSGNR